MGESGSILFHYGGGGAPSLISGTSFYSIHADSIDLLTRGEVGLGGVSRVEKATCIFLLLVFLLLLWRTFLCSFIYFMISPLSLHLCAPTIQSHYIVSLLALQIFLYSVRKGLFICHPPAHHHHHRFLFLPRPCHLLLRQIGDFSYGHGALCCCSIVPFHRNLLGVPELCDCLKQCGAGEKKGGRWGVKVLIIFSNQINREMEVVQ